MSSVGLAAGIIDILAVFMIAAVVGITVHKLVDFPYTIALLIAGVFAGLLGVDIGVELSHDIIFLVLLPPLLFEGAATTDLEKFRNNLLPVLLLAIPGLILSIIVLGLLANSALGLPILLSLLFATIILPTDPVSVLALFDELGAPDRLSVLVEGESLINDGVAVVIFTAFLEMIQAGTPVEKLMTVSGIFDITTGIAASSLGGALVGLVAGYVVFSVMNHLDEHRTEIILTILLAYGSFILAEHYIGVSGVIATVVAAIFLGNKGSEYAMSPQTRISIFNTWETAAFIVNTVIFVLIGARIPISQLVVYARPLAVAILLVLFARAVAVFPISRLSNMISEKKISFSEQQVMWWGGLHASIPIALVLGLPSGFPQREKISVLVFGVAGFSLVVQGLSMGRLLKKLGVITSAKERELYETLTGRLKANEAARDAADRLRSSGEIPHDIYENVEEEYSLEKQKLEKAISGLLEKHPEVKKEQALQSERRVLKEEKSLIMRMMRRGEVSDNIGEKLLEEVNLKLSKVRNGETTVGKGEHSFEEFWMEEARELGILDEEKEDEEDEPENPE